MAMVDHHYNGGGTTLLIDASPSTHTIVTSNGNSGISKLSQMQARFQQKQLQEKEQKLLQLYESQQQRAFQRVGRGSAGSSSVSSTTSSTTSSSSLGNGKVRQLFDERRTQKSTSTKTSGWDRSYPLEPLESTNTRSRSNKEQPQHRLGRGVSLERIYTQPILKKNLPRSKSQVRQGNLVNGGYTERRNHQQEYYNYDNEDYNEYIGDEVDATYHNKINSNRYHSNKTNNQQDIDQLFTKARPSIYDEEPLREGETFDDSQLFKKLSNVGGILLMKERTMNEDKYKTYNASSKRVVAGVGAKVGQKTVPQPFLRRRENDATTTTTAASPPARMATKPAVKPAVRKQEPLSTLSSNGTAVRKPIPQKETASAPLRTTPTAAAIKSTAPSQITAVNRASSSRAAPVPKPATSRPSPRGVLTAQNDNLSECSYCGRRFASDRVAMHQDICARTTQKKRKVFDPVKQRVKGTEAEAYVKIASKQQTQKAKAPPAKKSDWRRKHEEFINAIRAAKEVKAHLAAGGKLSDLPPPPPSENPDYVQCPHCSRKFNEGAAERHIPRCADMQHNKPKAKSQPTKSSFVAKKR